MALIKCPECGHEVSDKASSCPNCGYPLRTATSDESEKAEPFATDASEPVGVQTGENVSTAKDQKKNDRITAIVVSVMIFLIALAVINTKYGGLLRSSKKETSSSSSSSSTYSSSSSASSSKPSSSSSSQSSSSASSYSSSKSSEDDIQSSVYLLAKKCVKSHLKAPSTAEFCSMSECAFQKGEDGVYMMTGTVDSENGYGSKLRETWGIMAQVDGDKVSLVMLQIGDDTYFD